MLENPSVTVFDSIQCMVEELEIIRNVTRQQRTVLATAFAISASGHEDNFQERLSQQRLCASIAHVDQKERNIDELLILASNKKNLLSQTINVRKESNNKAILIFTVVTVIFLPLSFVSSYLGINSVDIRNSSFTQARFWQIALPVTVVVLAVVYVLLRLKRGVKRSFGRMGGGLLRLSRVGFWIRRKGRSVVKKDASHEV